MRRGRKEKIPFHKKRGHVHIPDKLRTLNMKERHAALATDSSGQPYTSLVAFTLTPDVRGALFTTPKKTSKYKNIMGNRKVSLLIDTRSNATKGYMESEALTILGTAVPVRRGKRWNELAGLFIKKHPQLADFVRAPSSALVFVSITRVIHAGKFQTVTEWATDEGEMEVGKI